MHTVRHDNIRSRVPAGPIDDEGDPPVAALIIRVERCSRNGESSPLSLLRSFALMAFSFRGLATLGLWPRACSSRVTQPDCAPASSATARKALPSNAARPPAGVIATTPGR